MLNNKVKRGVPRPPFNPQRLRFRFNGNRQDCSLTTCFIKYIHARTKRARAHIKNK